MDIQEGLLGVYDINDLKSALEQKLEGVKKYTVLVEFLKVEAQNLQYALDALRLLSISWNQKDPGKYSAAYWFLAGGERVVVNELLRPGLKIFGKTEEAEWQRYKSANWNSHCLDAVSPQFPVVSIADVDRERCPSCNGETPLIMGYEQIEDSDDGDVWKRWTFVICCQRNRLIGKEEFSPYRMF